MSSRLPCTIALGLALALSPRPRPAAAQSAPSQIAEEPTGGVQLPATPLAGEQDARATVLNPAGLHFAEGGLTLVVDAAAEASATRGGPGVGLFLGGGVGGAVLPRLGLGLGVEWLRPSRTRLRPDPGTPTRLTLSTSLPLGPHAALGVGWHRFYDDEPGSVLDGLGTWDVGLAARLGNRWAIGAVVRDVGAPFLGPRGGDRTIPVQRRYALELTSRPVGTDRLDLGLGGRVGERRGDVDGWLRATARVARGVFVHAAVETDALHVLSPTPSGDPVEREDRDLRASLGLELSFGGVGVATYGSAGLDEEGDAHALGGTVIARVSRGPAAVQGHPARIERLEITGDLGARALTRLVMRLRAIARDPAAKALVLTIDDVSAGWATVQEVHDELRRVRAAGKPVFAYLVDASTREYYLAAACDRIYLDPAGGLRVAGFAGTTFYFRGTFDKLGVDAEFEKIAEYKSAPESYTDLAPSAPALKMRDELYDGIFADLVDGIAAGRRLDRATAEALVRGGPYSAGQLVDDHRLVDAVADPDHVGELIEAALGGLYPVGGAPDERDDRWERPAIAVIYAEGDIVSGDSRSIPLPIPFLGRTVAGGESLIAALTAARLDPAVKAVVLRIDSPGGSALASELISREVFRLRGVKPILCSMSDVAASGGYFIAAGCDAIFAEPMTITGSIGIFYGKFDLSGLLGKLGITAVTARRGDHADMDSMYRPYTDEERAILQRELRYLYGRFTGTVAKGRAMSEAKVDEVGRGRVWTGRAAVGIGLVDKLGGIGDAIDYAKQLAHLAPDARVRLVELPRASGGLLGWLLGGVSAARARAAEPTALDALASLPAVQAILRTLPLSLLVEPDAAQARLPFVLDF